MKQSQNGLLLVYTFKNQQFAQYIGENRVGEPNTLKKLQDFYFDYLFKKINYYIYIINYTEILKKNIFPKSEMDMRNFGNYNQFKIMSQQGERKVTRLEFKTFH